MEIFPVIKCCDWHWLHVKKNVVINLQRELARQTHEIISFFCKHLEEAGFPALRSLLCIGGTAVKDQFDTIKRYDTLTTGP